MTHLKVAPLCTGHRKLLAQPCGAAARCRPRWLSFAAYITWICGSATGVELMWRSGGGVLNSSHGHQWVSIVGLCKSGRARPPPSPPRHIPSSIHFPELASRVSAGFFAPPAGVLGPASLGRFLGCGSTTFTCGAWCFRCSAWNGRWQCCTRACELFLRTPRVSAALLLYAFVDRVG